MHDHHIAPGDPHGEQRADQPAGERGGTADRPRIGFVGAGRVAGALALGLARAGWPVTAVASRDEQRRNRLAAQLPGARAFAEPNAVLDEADVLFLTVPDDALADLARGLHLYSGQALVHTSGAQPAAVLEPARAAGTSLGSFHPLVAFVGAERALDALSGATVALEGDASLLPLLAELAESLGATPVRLAPGTKPAYHAAATLAAGGVLALLDVIALLAHRAGLDERAALDVYLPLVHQALDNGSTLGLAGALSGPLRRGDAGTIEGHLRLLREHVPAALDVYVALARRELAMVRRSAVLPEESAAALDELLSTTVRPATASADELPI